MVEHRQKQIEKIKNAQDEKSVELIIDTFILEMRKNKKEDFRIGIFIRRLDISLLLIERKGLSDKECDNINHAQKILINKIVHGVISDIKKKVK